MSIEIILANFIFFFAVIDPIATIPVFIAVTKGYDRAVKRRIAFLATLVAGLVLLFFVVAGEHILTGIKIEVAAFQISGGIILFLFALSMIFGESKPESEVRLAEDHADTAIFPLAIPSIAGPGAMLGAVLLTENHRFTILEQAVTSIVMLKSL